MGLKKSIYSGEFVGRSFRRLISGIVISILLGWNTFIMELDKLGNDVKEGVTSWANFKRWMIIYWYSLKEGLKKGLAMTYRAVITFKENWEVKAVGTLGRDLFIVVLIFFFIYSSVSILFDILDMQRDEATNVFIRLGFTLIITVVLGMIYGTIMGIDIEPSVVAQHKKNNTSYNILHNLTKNQNLSSQHIPLVNISIIDLSR